jgi:hypothetical protein
MPVHLHGMFHSKEASMKVTNSIDLLTYKPGPAIFADVVHSRCERDMHICPNADAAIAMWTPPTVYKWAKHLESLVPSPN